MCAASQQQGSVSVPEIVPAYVWQTSTLQQGLEVPIYDVLCI
jgi:hypothetical protein